MKNNIFDIYLTNITIIIIINIIKLKTNILYKSINIILLNL